MPDTGVTNLPSTKQVEYLRLARGGAMSRQIASDGGMGVVYGCGRGASMELAGDGAALWIPLRGRLEVTTSGLMWSISRGMALVVDHGSPVKAVGYANSRWLVVYGAGGAWKAILGPGYGAKAQPIPELHDADHELLRLTIALVRDTAPPDADRSLRTLGDKLASMQSTLQQLMLRCPGRTLVQKHQVFVRFQCVRQAMRACCDQALDIVALARMANYSPCHFVRIFHRIYGTTPYAYLVAQRMERARDLLHSSGLAITEIAMATGFESRMSFSRQFRSHFGMTARESRRRTRQPAAGPDAMGCGSSAA